MKIVVVIMLIVSGLFGPTLLFSQDVISERKPGFHQKIWGVLHPLAACKAYGLTKVALSVSAEMKISPQLDGDAIGGQVDAFRHSYWMALLGQKIALKKAIRLGVAHEKDEFRMFKKRKWTSDEQGDSMATMMDLHNNWVGVMLGSENKNLDHKKLENLIVISILAGKMEVLLKDKAGNYLDCTGKQINMIEWKSRWDPPKCLSRSDRGRR